MTDEISPMTKLPGDIERELNEMLAEMHRLNALMDRDRADIVRLRRESDTLKHQTSQLGDETRAILARLLAA